MKIEYKILWLDDKIQEFIDDELILEIENHLIKEGFKPQIIVCSKIDDFYSKLDNTYDLILTDFHLTETVNGDKVVEEIRKPESAIFTEILFYTAQADLRDTDKISRITFLETNKKVGKHSEILISEIINLINLTIKKFQHIVAMRGMIMNETSSLDVEIEDILSKIIAKGDPKIIEVIKEKYLKTNTEFVDRITNCKDVADLLNYIGADHRVRSILRNIDNGKIKDILSDYTKQIIVVRNQFAHAVLDNKTNTFKTKNGIVFNDEECINIRNNINRHIDNLKNLQLLIN